MKKILAALMASVIFSASVNAVAYADGGSKKVTALISSSEVQLNAELYTSSYSWNWNNCSPISDFIDNGRYTIAYADGKNVYICHISDKGDIADTVKFKQPMSAVGGVTCDAYGNFYVACGTTDSAGEGKICTFAVYKYDSKGALLGKAEYYPDDTNWSTKTPFEAGNCAMAFQGDLLICSYARKMYNGHQSNAVFCVDTVTMTENPLYDSYASHSFNQSIAVIDDATVAFADHGDAYPRGFSVNVRSDTSDPMMGHNSNGAFVPFHFSLSGDSSNMFNVNYTNSRLTGICRLDSGIALVGSSGDYDEETPQQLFLQIIDPDSGEQVLSGATREGSSAYGGLYKDTGIKWLTSYTDGSYVKASAMAALDDSRLLVMWERWRDHAFVNSYYSIISSDGRIMVDSVSMQHALLNGAEELKVNGDTAYWTYSKGNEKDATVYMLDTSSTSNDILKEATIELSYLWREYTGKALKPAVTVIYDGKTLKKGRDYTVSYKNNKKPGIATVTVKGKGEYSGTATTTFEISPKPVTNVKAVRKNSKNTITWKAANVSGYEVEISKLVKDGYYYWQDSSVTKTVTKTKYVHKAKTKDGVMYEYRVRPFVKVNGVKVYGDWSEAVNTDMN